MDGSRAQAAIVKHHEGARSQSKIVESRRRWQDLPIDVLFHIFKKLENHSLVENVSPVCSSWRSACWDVLFWKPNQVIGHRLHIPNLSFYNLLGRCLFNDDISPLRLLQSLMVDKEIDGSFKISSILTLSIHEHVYLSGNHLIYMATRTPKLKKLLLPCARSSIVEGFAEAIVQWRELEDICFGPCEMLSMKNLERVMQGIGINCNKLTRLSLTQFPVDEESASVIGKNLGKLEGLEMILTYSCIDIPGLKTLLSKTTKLMALQTDPCKERVEANDQPEIHAVIFKVRGDGKDSRWCYNDSEKSFNSSEMANLLLGQFQ